MQKLNAKEIRAIALRKCAAVLWNFQVMETALDGYYDNISDVDLCKIDEYVKNEAVKIAQRAEKTLGTFNIGIGNIDDILNNDFYEKV